MTRAQARWLLGIVPVLIVLLAAQVASAAGMGVRSAQLTTLEAPVVLSPTSLPSETTTTTVPTNTTMPAPQPVTVALVAEADGSVDSQRPTAAAGTTDTMATSSHPKRTKYAFVRFDLTSIPAGARIDAAVLSLRRTDAAATEFTLDRAASGWSESGLTWSSMPAGAGASSGMRSSTTTVSWSDVVTTDVSDMVAVPATNHGWRVRTGSNQDRSLHTREAATAQRPILVVTYVVP